MSEKKIGIGSILIGTLGLISVAGIAGSVAEHCSDEKTERRKIGFEEVQYICDSQERIARIKAQMEE